MIRIEGFAGLQDAEDNVNKFAHGGDDDLHFLFAVASQTLTSGWSYECRMIIDTKEVK